MDDSTLTPVRVRGKQKVGNKSAPKTLASGQFRKHKRGRPMKRPEDLAPKNRLRKCFQPIEETSVTTSSKLTRIEQLPTEIIERIFALGVNPNLAEASPWIARQVSSERMYRAFMLYAFFKDDRLRYVQKNQECYVAIDQDEELSQALWIECGVKLDSFIPIDYVPLQSGQMLELQKEIMSRRWFTYERFEEILPFLLEISWTQQLKLHEFLRRRATVEIAELPWNNPFSKYYRRRYKRQKDKIEQLPPLRMPVLRPRCDSIHHLVWQPAPYCHIVHLPNKLFNLSPLPSSPRLPNNNGTSRASKPLTFLSLILETQYPHLSLDTPIPHIPPAFQFHLDVPTIKTSIERSVHQYNIPSLQTLCFLLYNSSTDPPSMPIETPIPLRSSPQINYLVPSFLFSTVAAAAPSDTSIPTPTLQIRSQVLRRLSLFPDAIPRNDPTLTRWALRVVRIHQSLSSRPTPKKPLQQYITQEEDRNGNGHDGNDVVNDQMFIFAKSLLEFMESGNRDHLIVYTAESEVPVVSEGNDYSEVVIDGNDNHNDANDDNNSDDDNGDDDEDEEDDDDDRGSNSNDNNNKIGKTWAQLSGHEKDILEQPFRRFIEEYAEWMAR